MEEFNFGYNVFESMRAYKGKVFYLEEHLDRFEESAKSIGFEINYSRKILKVKILKKLEESNLKDAYIRIAMDSKSKIEIIVKPIKTYPEEFYREGVKAVTVAVKKEAISSLFPQAKTGNFLNGILAKIEANLRGDFFEAVLINREGFVTEGTVSNIFMVKNEILFTPPLYLGILPGITRKVVIDLAKDLRIEFKDIPFTRHELYNADEVFLTNTSIEIMPVRYIDNREIGKNNFCKITDILRKKFIERRQKCIK